MSGGKTNASWRCMTADDLAFVVALAARIHPAFPEDADVFAERLRLYPEGCHVRADGNSLTAYAFSHPWRAFDAPALNSRLGGLPAAPETYYIHDLALAAEARGTGAAAAILDHLARYARGKGYRTMSLVAVNGSAEFWRRQGFARTDVAALAGKLRSYGDAGACFMVRTL